MEVVVAVVVEVVGGEEWREQRTGEPRNERLGRHDERRPRRG